MRATKPCHGLFVRAKLHLGAADKVHPHPCALVTRREPKRLFLVALRLLRATIKYLGQTDAMRAHWPNLD